VLQKKNDVWLIPGVPDSVLPDTTITRHSKPIKSAFPKLLGSVSQQVVHDSAVVSREFYRFTKRGVELLGYESTDSTQLLTIYEPPLIVMTANLETADSTQLTQAVPKTWDAKADSFRFGQKTKLHLKTIQTGSVKIDSTIVPALLVEMRLTMDGTVGYGSTNLIVPDAIQMQSNILFVSNLGPVLEWGVRSRKKELGKTAVAENTRGGENQQQFEEREYFIEVTLHHQVAL
jgi:hypothetical protein